MVDEEVKEKILNHFELGNELYALAENNIIPLFVADKIKEKVTEANINLTKSQLNDLVDIIKKEIQTHKYKRPDTKENSKSPNLAEKPDDLESEDKDVKEIFRSINGLGKRIGRIEDVKVKDYEEPVGRIVTTEDIQIPEKISVPRYGGNVHPLMAIPNDPERVVVLMKWLQFLVDKVGKDNLSDVLDYYVDIGWLSEKIVVNLMEYSEGITEEREHKEFTEKKELQAKDHIQSLLFIQRLKGEHPDNYFLHRIERKIGKMTKNLSNE